MSEQSHIQGMLPSTCFVIIQPIWFFSQDKQKYDFQTSNYVRAQGNTCPKSLRTRVNDGRMIHNNTRVFKRISGNNWEEFSTLVSSRLDDFLYT